MDYRCIHNPCFEHKFAPAIQHPLPVKNYAFNLLLALFFQSCASIKSPEGGPKDSQAPLLLESNPRNGEVNFREKSIILEYSEPVVENDAKTPFLSPYIPLTVTPMGRRIRISPDSGWKANQTYELRLNKKVKDEREGNMAADTSIIFSTGNEPDRIQIQTSVSDLSGNGLKGESTLLLNSASGNRYFSSGEGKIRLAGLKEGKYLMEVFQDKNENLKYEEEDGRLYTDSIRLDSNSSVRVRPLPQLYKNIRYYHQHKGDTLQIECSRKILADSNLLKYTIAKSEDGLMYWMYPFRKNIIINNQDSCGTLFPDTLDISKTDSIRSLSTIPMKQSNKILRSGNQLQVDFLWNWKVLKHPEKLEYSKDSVWEKVIPEKLDFGYRIKIPVLKPGKIKIRIDSILFYNRRGFKKDSLLITTKDLEEGGTISGIIESEETNLITELINPNRELCGRTTTRNFSWKVRPGTYTLQVFKDKNNDQKYTGGNRNLQRKAEPLYIIPMPIELKPGWDVENVKVVPEF